MLIGYARTSTADQVAGLEAQVAALKAAGCDKVYHERVSSVAERAQLDAALEYVRDGDTLVVTKLDRLARSVADFLHIERLATAKGATVRIMDLNLDTGSATARLTLNLFASVAQFEREIMLERQREGIAKAKVEGKYKGRAPTARAKADEVVALHKAGKRPSHIARETGIGRASVYRVLAEAGINVAGAADIEDGAASTANV